MRKREDKEDWQGHEGGLLLLKTLGVQLRDKLVRGARRAVLQALLLNLDLLMENSFYECCPGSTSSLQA